MIPSLVIGLREGLEASLIVGIVAAFLSQRATDKRAALRSMWLGVSSAIALCLAVGAGFHFAQRELPEKQQEQLETIIALVAVAMVTWMILWMRKYAHTLKGRLESQAGDALATGSMRALVLMAFLAVLREGFETVVFLLATFRNADNAALAFTGAVLGIAISVVLGYAIYRGGLKINLARFFKVTGVVLVIVAAGLLAMAAHSAEEAGWIDIAQSQAFDISGIIKPGSVISALALGMFGIRPQPVVLEVIVWLAYAVPMLAIVLWPTSRNRSQAQPVVQLDQADQQAQIEPVQV